MVPFFDLRRTYLEQKDEIDRAINAVMDGGWYILGASGQAFEARLKSSLVGERQGYALGCNSGTDALILALLAAGVGAGDEVITVSHTAIPTITAIRSTGATPVFVDLDPETWVMDTSRLDAALTPKTKAIVTVHLYGNMVDIPSVRAALRQAGRDDVAIIEDVAQAHGAALAGEQAGTLGRFGAFSFYPSKNIGAYGDGGAIFCQTESDCDLVRMLRNYGQKDRYYAGVDRGTNSRLDEIQAAILSVKLPHLEAWNRRKEQLMSTYRSELASLPLRFQRVTPGVTPAWHLCVIAVEDRSVRDQLMAHLQAQAIQTLIHYPHPTHLQHAFKTSDTVRLPITETLADSILSLPMNAVLADQEQELVIAGVKSFFART